MNKIDVLFTGGSIYPGTAPDRRFGCMGVRRGKICWLSDQLPQGAKIGRQVDLGGKNVYPALTDSHLHLLFTIVQCASDAQVCTIQGREVVPSDLSGVAQRIREIARNTPKGQIIAATNYIMSAMAERRMPTRQELDSWAQGAPVVLYNIDGHSASLSTAMLRRIGIDPDTHSGVLTGWEHESLQGKITGAIASGIRPSTLARGIAHFTNQCAGFGIGRVCALDGSVDNGKKDTLLSLLVFLARRMEIGVRLYPQYISPRRALPLVKYMRTPRIGGCGEWEMDGSVGSHSAAFEEPFSDTGETSPCYYTQRFVEETVAEAQGLGFQISAHAIGECAIRRIQTALQKLGTDKINRIEHYEFPSLVSVEQLKGANIAITVQPGYSWLDKRYLHSYRHFLDPETIAKQVPLARLVREGVLVCGSSDSPVQSIDPFAQMLGMIDFYIPQQSLTAFEAFQTYSASPAAMLGEKEAWGTLETGKDADFFVTGADLFACTAEEIAGVRAEALYLAGRQVKKKRGTLAELIWLALRRPKRI